MKKLPILISIALAAVLAGCGSTSSSSGGTPSGPKVAGRVRLGGLAFLGDQKEAVKKLSSKDAYCQWEGSDVHMHITFHNGLDAHITVSVNPAYTLKDAGIHGIGMSNEQSVGINARATRVWDGDTGAPAGVSGTPRITKCSPRIQDVDLG